LVPVGPEEVILEFLGAPAFLTPFLQQAEGPPLQAGLVVVAELTPVVVRRLEPQVLRGRATLEVAAPAIKVVEAAESPAVGQVVLELTAEGVAQGRVQQP
jgi:hypothetical protein